MLLLYTCMPQRQWICVIQPCTAATFTILCFRNGCWDCGMCCEPTNYHSLHTVCTKITPVRDYFHFKTDKTGEPMDSNETITGRPPCSLKMNKQVRVTDAIKWSRNIICDYSIYRLDGWRIKALALFYRQTMPASSRSHENLPLCLCTSLISHSM